MHSWQLCPFLRLVSFHLYQVINFFFRIPGSMDGQRCTNSSSLRYRCSIHFQLRKSLCQQVHKDFIAGKPSVNIQLFYR